MDYARFAFVCVFFGSNFVLMHRALHWFTPVEVAVGRLIGATLLLAVIWAFWEPATRLRRRDWLNAALVGLIVHGYPYVAQPILLGQGFGHSFFGMTVAFTPLLTILSSALIMGLRPSWRELVGVVTGLGFIGLLMFDGNQRGIAPWMLVMAFTVPLSYAIGNVWLRKTLNDADPTPLSAVMTALPALLLAPLMASPATQRALGLPSAEPRQDALVACGAITVLGIVGTGACMWLFVKMIQSRGPLFAGMVTYVVPLVALTWGLVDRETITTRQVIAMLGILGTVALVQSASRRHLRKPAPREATPEPLEELAQAVSPEPTPRVG
ncbi:MAG: DMT family transporter [Lacipirellulaceae bacterium]